MKEDKPRGFAAMTPEQRRKIASLGGRAAQATGTAHHWTPDEARSAGAKGAASGHRKRRRHETGGA
jgi:hypothetical protein